MSARLPVRSLLFVPASNARALAKASALAADGLIFDLEDSVGDNEQTEGMAGLERLLTEAEFKAPQRLLRIRPDALNETADRFSGFVNKGALNGIVVPKVEGPEDLIRVEEAFGAQTPLWAMIETPLGVVNLRAISQAPVELIGLIVGPNDLRHQLGATALADRQDILFALSQTILYARAFGLKVIDGVYNAFRDEAGFARECAHGRALGFDGKTLIHPSQIEPANAFFGPDQAQISWAQAVVDAFAQPENLGKAVVAVNGEMVETMHLETARHWLSLGAERT